MFCVDVHLRFFRINFVCFKMFHHDLFENGRDEVRVQMTEWPECITVNCTQHILLPLFSFCSVDLFFFFDDFPNKTSSPAAAELINMECDEFFQVFVCALHRSEPRSNETNGVCDRNSQGSSLGSSNTWRHTHLMPVDVRDLNGPHLQASVHRNEEPQPSWSLGSELAGRDWRETRPNWVQPYWSLTWCNLSPQKWKVFKNHSEGSNQQMAERCRELTIARVIP